MNSHSTNCPICQHSSLFSFSGRDLMFDLHDRYDYYKCQSCELIFQQPIPSEAEISQFYPNSYDVYEERTRLKKINPMRAARLKRSFGYTHLKVGLPYRIISNLTSCLKSDSFEVPYIKDGRLLDIGCGNGRYLHGMNQLGWNTTGVEFNASAVNVCRKSNLDVHHGDLFSAKFKANTFDVVNISHLIEHVPDPQALFMEISRVIKPNGLLIVKTPNSQALGRALFDTKWYANDVPRHLYLFSEKNLLSLAKTNHFELLETSTHSTQKIILNSVDYVTKNTGTPSKKIWWRRLLAKPYAWLSIHKRRGDEIQMVLKRA